MLPAVALDNYRFLRRLLVAFAISLYLFIDLPVSLAQSSAGGILECAKNPSCAAQLGIPLRNGVPIGLVPPLPPSPYPMIPGALPYIFGPEGQRRMQWPTPGAADDMSRRLLPRRPVTPSQAPGNHGTRVAGVHYSGGLSSGYFESLSWYLEPIENPILPGLVNLWSYGCDGILSGIGGYTVGATTDGPANCMVSGPLRDPIPDPMLRDLPGLLQPGELPEILERPGNVGEVPVPEQPLTLPVPAVVQPPAPYPPFTVPAGQPIPGIGGTPYPPGLGPGGSGNGGSDPSPSPSPSLSPDPNPSISPSPSESPSPSPGGNSFKDEFTLDNNPFTPPSATPIQPTQLDTKNFLQHALSVFSTKFPLDFFGTYTGSSSVPDCPNYTFFGKDFELCPIKDLVFVLKFPAIISYAIWALMAI